jgi:predicted AAA+ superfamily ATPase
MTWKSRKREAERRLDNLEERETEGLARHREHKVYAGIDLGKLPGMEAAQERVADAPTVHFTEDREAAEELLEGARTFGWNYERERARDAEESAESAEDGTRE